MGAFAFVVDFLDFRGVFAGCAFDCGLDVFTGEVFRLGIGDGDPEWSIGFGVGSAILCGEGDGFREFGEHLGHRGPAAFLGSSSALECSSHGVEWLVFGWMWLGGNLGKVTDAVKADQIVAAG